MAALVMHAKVCNENGAIFLVVSLWFVSLLNLYALAWSSY